MSNSVCAIESPSLHANRCLNTSPEGTLVLSRDDFEYFVREYSERLRASAMRFLRSAEDAADAVQDALLSAYAARHTFQGQSSVYTWLYRIVVNTCLMKVRARELRKNCRRETIRSICQNQADIADETIVPVCEALEREEARLVLHAKINELPDIYRTVLLLRDIEELNTTETARRLQLSLEAVKTRVHRARHALRALLDDPATQLVD